MNTAQLRDQLHEQIDELPDDVIEQIAHFTRFVIDRWQSPASYSEWNQPQWQEFALKQFFREEDEVTYTLQDAQEVFHS